MRNLGLDRPFGWFSSERVDLGREAVQLPAETFEGSETVFNTGNTARRVSNNVVALARHIGSGRGGSQRSGQPGFLDRGGVTRRGISRQAPSRQRSMAVAARAP